MFSGLTETITNVESALLSPGQREMMLEHVLRTQTSSPDALKELLLDDMLHRTIFSPRPYYALEWRFDTEELRASSVSTGAERC
jgi:hypothetical protein